jgi:uncharacterized protein YbaR (Trm112 family)
MFIELTDHLRCPEDHDEGYLVLLPDQLDGRFVKTGHLGCPVCGRTFELRDGIWDTGSAPDPGGEPSGLTAEAVTVLAGLSGPGGYLGLIGSPGSLGREIAQAMPGVALVAVNPPRGVTDGDGVSVIRSGRIPLKSRSLRGVVLGRHYAEDPYWVAEAARVVLPGLRVVGEGSDPPAESIDIMASTGHTWVGSMRR